MTRTQADDRRTDNNQPTSNNDTMTRPKSGRTRTLETIESIEINIDDAVEALRKNWENESRRGKLVLRVTPPYDDVNEAHTHFSENRRHYSGDAPFPIHIKPESVVVGHENGYNSHAWKQEYNFPDESESKHLYESEASDDEDWGDWWDESIKFWEREVRHAIKQTETITFPDPDRIDNSFSIPVNIVEGGE